MQTLLLIQDDELAVLVGLLQDVLALLNVAVVVFQAEEGGHQCHIGLKGDSTTSTPHIPGSTFQSGCLSLREERQFEV